MPADRFSDTERRAFYAAIAALDPKRTYVIADAEADTLSYTGAFKSHETVSGRPRDEELTRAFILAQLFTRYGHQPSRIEIENSFEIGGRNTARARAVETDIVIRDATGAIETICEIKRVHEFLGVDDPAIRRQLFTPRENIVRYNAAKYLFHLTVDVPLAPDQFPLRCIGIDATRAPTFADWEQQGRPTHFVDLPRGDSAPVAATILVKSARLPAAPASVPAAPQADPTPPDLNDAFGRDELMRRWRQVWDAIWGGTLEDNKNFENFNKVLLAKIYDERQRPAGQQEGPRQRQADGASELGLVATPHQTV